jgi:hypothetical protein
MMDMMHNARESIVYLLVAALHGAVSLRQVDNVSMLVSDKLNLDVSRIFYKLLHE